jgi:hypothetical protein
LQLTFHTLFESDLDLFYNLFEMVIDFQNPQSTPKGLKRVLMSDPDTAVPFKTFRDSDGGAAVGDGQ